MPEPLAQLTWAVLAKRRADEEYRVALLAAVAALEARGDPAPFAKVAKIAGVSRQAVRQLVVASRTS